MKCIHCGKHNYQDESHRETTKSSQGIKKRVKSTSKYVGVCWNKERKKWKASIKNKSVMINLGHFDSETEAAQAYNDKAIELLGDDAYLNEIN